MKFEFSKHASEQMERRDISRAIVEEILNAPDHVVLEDDKKIYHSVVSAEGKIYLIISSLITTKIQIWLSRFIKHQKSASIMKVKYDKDVDVLYLLFSDNKISESDEDKPGVILDYDSAGTIVGIEILDASKKMKNPANVEYIAA